ncbi:hypothetical protein [Halosegnis sp.]|uniref:hypothetical protein n=1 Tax=Halosegnis sp. TaxID=2864959 RepID=UPI0035D490BA
MDEADLVERLDRFGGSEAERRAVARCARDLADSDAFRRDEGYDLTVETVLNHLADAPDGGPADRWNWWLGSLEAAHGDYARFQVRRWEEA